MPELSTIMKAVEAAWKDLQLTDPDIPPAKIITGSGRGPTIDIGASIPVVFVPEQVLECGPTAIMTTLGHEAAHLLAEQCGAEDTSRNGIYHNLTFRNIVDSLGFEAKPHSAQGYRLVALKDPATRYSKPIDRLRALLSDAIEPPGGAVLLTCRPQRVSRPGRAGGAAICRCDPPRTIRTAASTLARGPILCGLCKQPFRARKVTR